MRNQERISYAVDGPENFVQQPWRAHRHIATRVVRPNEFLGIQTVTFATANQRDHFLREQKNAVVPIMRKRKQGCYGSHPRHNFNRKPRRD